MKKVLNTKTPRSAQKRTPQSIPVCWKRYRLLYFFLLIVTIALGIAIRELAAVIPEWISLYGGDALWSAMVFFLIAFVFAKMPTYAVGVFALTFSIAIEFSQLYHAPWIDQLRATDFGHLVLGNTFAVSDLFCYAAGVAIAVTADILLKKARRPC